ncbi:hypothetical protein HDU92_008494, partial [Lobulomyces angularis]
MQIFHFTYYVVGHFHYGAPFNYLICWIGKILVELTHLPNMEFYYKAISSPIWGQLRGENSILIKEIERDNELLYNEYDGFEVPGSSLLLVMVSLFYVMMRSQSQSTSQASGRCLYILKDLNVHGRPNKNSGLSEDRKIMGQRRFHSSTRFSKETDTKGIRKAAYDKVRRNPNTKGTNNTTLDGINKDWFNKTSSDIRTGRFSFKPARRLDIPKPKVLEAMRMILEAIFEPTFHHTSHGFRPKRSCHSALNDIKMKFGSSHWFIEGDISKCFDTIDHKRAGYISFDKIFHNTKVGAPQGSDKWIDDYTTSFNKGERRRANPEYTKIIRRKVSKLEQVKRIVAIYKSKINSLMGNDEKTRITHSKEPVRFLGTDVKITPFDKYQRRYVTKLGKRKLVSFKPRPQLLAPISYLCNKLVEKKYAKISKGSIVPTRNARMYYILKYSCALTICSKMKLNTLRKTFKKYGPDLTVETKDKKKISFPKYDEFKSKHILKLNYNYDPASIIDLFSKKTYRTITMTNAICSICGSNEQVEMHHINKISNISPSNKDNYTKSLMIRLNRRQIPVCLPCHIKIHKEPYDAKVSRTVRERLSGSL